MNLMRLRITERIWTTGLASRTWGYNACAAVTWAITIATAIKARGASGKHWDNGSEADTELSGFTGIFETHYISPINVTKNVEEI